MPLEQYLCDFEHECDCVLSVHDLGRVFVDATKQSLIRSERGSHRKRIAVCADENRDYCMKCCMMQVNRRVLQRHEASFIKHCRKGVIEVVAPLMRDRAHVATFFAGVWQSRFRRNDLNLTTVDRLKIQRLRRLLPVFATGLLEQAAKIRCCDTREFSRRAEIRDFIRSNAERSLTLQELADHLSLSPSRTCHLVKECFGESFNCLLTEERIERARQLLITTDYRMKEIAEFIGMGTPEHFSRTFLRYTKLSPGTYRKRYRMRWD